jgi:hypothetical protein
MRWLQSTPKGSSSIAATGFRPNVYDNRFKSFSLTPVPRVRKARHRTLRKRRRAEAGVRAIGPLPASLTTLVVVDVAVLTF